MIVMFRYIQVDETADVIMFSEQQFGLLLVACTFIEAREAVTHEVVAARAWDEPILVYSF